MSLINRTVRVKVFPGAQNLPLLVAKAKGFFVGLNVEIFFTANSSELRIGLEAEDFEIAHTAVDNALALFRAGVKVTVFMGGDSGMNELFVQPEVKNIASLRERVVLVDAPDTAYALQLRAILLEKGMTAGIDYQLLPVGATYQREIKMAQDESCAASILNPPFSIRSRARGLTSLGRVVDLIGPYQATAGFALSSWFKNHTLLVDAYILGYLRALRWLYHGSHRSEASAMLQRHLDIDQALANETLENLLEPGFGLAPDAALNTQGLANVFALRARVDQELSVGLPTVDELVDQTSYHAAVCRLNAMPLDEGTHG